MDKLNLEVLPLRFILESEGPLKLSDLAGTVRMRGAFGLIFRRLVCPPGWWNRACRSCELWRACPYPMFFEPAPPEGSDRLSKNADIPRPYVFRSAGVDNEFDVTLIGRGSGALPYFVVALRELGAQGFGPVRRRFALERVETRQENPQTIFDRSDNLVRMPRPVSKSHDPPPPSAAGRRRYRFETPAILKSNGVVEEVPTYATLVKRARDRINALSTFFGDGPHEWDFKGMGERAEQVRTASVAGGTRTHGRLSRRRGQFHDLSGFVGEIAYEGPEETFAEFDPLLALLAEIHVGKGAAFGNGRVSTVPSGAERLREPCHG